MWRQERINESAADAFEQGTIVFNELAGKIRFLKKLAAGFAFVAGGLIAAVMKTKSAIRAIRKVMNEG